MAAAIVRDGKLLLARRHVEAHQGGLWEFPGGKVECGEDVRTALARELDEELGITLESARPLISVPHDYPDKSILLDVWRVDGFSGDAHGREGQPLMWVAIDELQQHDFPRANLPVITAMQLPAHYLITPDPVKEGDQFLKRLEVSLQAGVRLVQLRAKSLARPAYCALAVEVKVLCRRYEAKLLLNGSADMVLAVGADGLHLSGDELSSLNNRPLGCDYKLSASCHDAAELKQASDVGIDFAVLSPVMPTNTHPGAETLGWQQFESLLEASQVPVYALGGMMLADLATAQNAGAQGVAAIGALWNLESLEV
ncbi:MAG: Nudix family hydrolase [Gammaproteobacteria bacterium]|nr:Nudix family hydrolase [Gammaproteobacteria bacterium]